MLRGLRVCDREAKYLLPFGRLNCSTRTPFTGLHSAVLAISDCVDSGYCAQTSLVVIC